MTSSTDIKIGDRVIYMFEKISRISGKRTSINFFYGAVAGDVYGEGNHVIEDMIKIKSDDGRMWSCLKSSVYKPI